jgi:hypothetical protein
MSQTCVDMKVQHRIDVERGRWASCKSVTLRDDVLHCTLEPKQTYDLIEAYEDDLHIRFANANSDKELIAFLHGWGPLYKPNWQIPSNGVVSLPLSHCRAYQRWIRALLDLHVAFKQAEREQEALLAFLEAEQESQHPDEPVSFVMLRPSFKIAGDVLDFVKSANTSTVQALIRYLIPISSGTMNCVNLVCRDEGNNRRLEAGWDIPDLHTAIRWMIWYDEFTKHPVICCPECRKVFRGETAHARKFCGEACAKKVSARNWRKKDLENKRTAKEKELRERKGNGIKKAR